MTGKTTKPQATWSFWMLEQATKSTSVMDAILGTAASHLEHWGEIETNLLFVSHKYMARAIEVHRRDLDGGVNESNTSTIVATCALICMHTILRGYSLESDSNERQPHDWFISSRKSLHLIKWVSPMIENSNIGQEFSALGSIIPHGIHTNPFSFLLHWNPQSNSIHQEEIEICTMAVAHLSYIYAKLVTEKPLRFLVAVSDNFVDLVVAKNPRALAICGYFFMVVRQGRQIWWIDGAPEREFDLVMRCLPKEWRPAMDWAVRVFQWNDRTTVLRNRRGELIGMPGVKSGGGEKSSVLGSFMIVMDTDTERISVGSVLKELHAYAKLLFLRSGRQFEDKALYKEREDEVYPDESGIDSSSSKNVPLGNLDTDHLRRKFLDRLSETVSSIKGGRHVVASYMFYWPDKHLLPQRTPSELTDNSILPDMDEGMLVFEDCLKLLAKLLFGEGDSGLERQDSLVALSYTLYRTFAAEEFQALGRQGEKVHREIGFLGRLQISFHVLVAAARQISGFDSLSLIPVVNPKARKKPSSPEWSLVKTFNALNIELSDTAIEKLMGSSSSKVKWTKNKLITDFSRLKSPTWEVHAEIQLIVFTLSHHNDIANGKRFNYIGCSSWTLPPGDNLGKDEQLALYGAAIEVISWMRKKLIRSTMVPAQRISEVKESTISGSLISMLGTSQEGHQ
ncbi:hypothetical protein FAUST_10966 [Fusarium austroamericanum]|uniref:Transcription factor domain-containing protein n=1 Tax=Fusarium austroamericanum TaxID=282268 RepID=A0AAN5Z0D1_FUSAU|nr:hypothetical protein FAUST_10966 [Fusarium austroamericanum]